MFGHSLVRDLIIFAANSQSLPLLRLLLFFLLLLVLKLKLRLQLVNLFIPLNLFFFLLPGNLLPHLLEVVEVPFQVCLHDCLGLLLHSHILDELDLLDVLLLIVVNFIYPLLELSVLPSALLLHLLNRTDVFYQALHLPVGLAFERTPDNILHTLSRRAFFLSLDGSTLEFNSSPSTNDTCSWSFRPRSEEVVGSSHARGSTFLSS